MISNLLGITYSEFDNTVGPKLLYTYPLEVMSKERFEELSDYVIVGKHLCKKIIIIKNEDIQYMNYSVAIENAKYFRNSLLFSLGFILRDGIETEPYEPILRKLSLAFLSLENESEFLFLESTKPQIQDVLQRLYEDLIETGETFINLDENNILTAKIFRAPREPTEIFEYNVPILRYDRISQINIPWDISLNYLLSRIDGISHIKNIASRKPAIDIECVKRCLRTLLFYDCVVITDTVRLTNIYQLQPSVHSMITDFVIMTGIQEFCCVDSDEPPSLRNIAKFLLKLRPGKPLSQVLISLGVDCLCGINVRRLVAVAQDLKMIARLHEYPVYKYEYKSEGSCTAAANASIRIEKSESSYDIQRLLNSCANRPVQSHQNMAASASTSCKEPAFAGTLTSLRNRKIFRRDIAGGGNTDIAAIPELNVVDVDAALCSLKGDDCLDSICCAFDVDPSDILDTNKYYIMYK